jgi:hypothetical protein
VEDVDAQRDAGGDVHDRDRDAIEADEHVVVGVAAHEVGVGWPPRLVEQVVDEEEPDDHAGPPHRARCEVGGDVVALRLVLHRTGGVVHARELVGRHDVEEERGDQHRAQRPEHDGPRERRLAEIPQPLGVGVDLVPAEEHLQGADHVGEDVTEQDDPAHRHHPLLADGGFPESDEEVSGRLRERYRRTDVADELGGRVGVGLLVGSRDLFVHCGHGSEPTLRPGGKWDCENCHEGAR